MKKFLKVVYVVDILFIMLSTRILIWWIDNHNEPGLAEKLNIKRHILYMIIEICIFLILTIVFIVKRKKKNTKIEKQQVKE